MSSHMDQVNGDDANAGADDDYVDDDDVADDDDDDDADEVNDDEDDGKKGEDGRNKDGRSPPLLNYIVIQHKYCHYFGDDVYVNGFEVQLNMMMNMTKGQVV